MSQQNVLKRMYPVNHGVNNMDMYYKATAELLDSFTRERIEDLVDLTGAGCLDVVTGGGTLAAWLCDRVGASGHVLTIDFTPREVPVRRNLTFMVHDLTDTENLGAGYDFVNVRLALAHLPPREHVLHRLVNTMDKGSVILSQDWWMTAADDVVIEAPTDSVAEILRRTYATYLVVLRKSGYSMSWAKDAHDKMIEQGLVDVTTHVYGAGSDYQWRGGGPGARYLSACLVQSRGHLIANGMTSVDLDRVASLLADPQVVVRGHQLYSTSGRKPGSNPHTKRRRG
jgi:SAM-dependent methyltransferase